MGEDEVESGEVFAVDGEGVVGECVADLGFDGWVLGLEGEGVCGWEGVERDYCRGCEVGGG